MSRVPGVELRVDGGFVGTRDGETSIPVVVKGSNLAEQLTQADVVSGDLTFSAPVEYVEIYNTDTTNAGVFTVNGVAITMPPDTVFGPTRVGTTPAAVVEVAGATTSYIVSRYA